MQTHTQTFITTPQTQGALLELSKALATLQRAVVAIMQRLEPASSDARSNYVGQATDREDFERRRAAWEAHEARLRALPEVF